MNFKRVVSVVFGKNSRSENIFWNIVLSVIIRILFAGLSLYLVNLSLHILDKESYGVWLTISSLITWLYYFDFGIANGFRNKFTHAISIGDTELAQKYISTTYYILGLIGFLVIVLFLGLNLFIDWQVVFNVPAEKMGEVNQLIYFVFLAFGFKLALSVLNTALVSSHRMALSNGIELITTLLTILFMIYYKSNIEGSLFFVGVIFSLLPVFVLLIASIVVFKTILRNYKPTFKQIDQSLIRGLFSMGFKFFIIQIAVILMFSANSLIVAQFFGPEEVTSFNLVSKLYSIPLLGFSIVITPFWAGFADAFHKGERGWIWKVVKRLIYVWILFGLGVFVLTFYINEIVFFWIGQSIQIPIWLPLFSGVFVMVSTWSSIFVYFVNGLEKVKIQFIGSIIIALVSIPISVFCCNYLHFGSEGVLLSNCLVIIPGAILAPYQFFLIMNNKARGIWNK